MPEVLRPENLMVSVVPMEAAHQFYSPEEMLPQFPQEKGRLEFPITDPVEIQWFFQELGALYGKAFTAYLNGLIPYPKQIFQNNQTESIWHNPTRDELCFVIEGQDAKYRVRGFNGRQQPSSHAFWGVGLQVIGYESVGRVLWKNNGKGQQPPSACARAVVQEYDPESELLEKFYAKIGHPPDIIYGGRMYELYSTDTT